MTLDDICSKILECPLTQHRRLIAVAGPPASGKSTLSLAFAKRLAERGEVATIVPMDGFHLDDQLLRCDGTHSRKGAPHTFDAHGFVRLIKALQNSEPVIFPKFDRATETAIAGAIRVPAACKTVLVEGNYLLLRSEPWLQLLPLWSLSIALHPPKDELIKRLSARWKRHNKPNAQAWIQSNDIPNIETVLAHSAAADITVRQLNLK